ncbi:MAG: TIGR01459 family HAD-type hydrolase [Pseudomonadota bacterium]
MTLPLPSLLALLDDFDAFVLDQWGVLHDGSRALPGAREAVMGLLDAGKVIVTLSNSGRRRAHAEAMMAGMGFPVGRFRANVTSGEAAFAGLAAGFVAGWPLPGLRCYLLCRDGDTSVIDGSGVERVNDPLDADFVMLSGVQGDRYDLSHYLEELAPAMARRLPVVCSNPDLVAATALGNELSPGAVAEAYRARTGVAPVYVGKPYRPVYDRCLEVLPDVSRARVVCVGDSLSHDVKGGAGAGLRTLFCAAGIHGSAFDPNRPLAEQIDRVRALAAEHDAPPPDYAIDRFRWS